MAFDEVYRAFVARHPGATLWHDPEFLEALAPGSDRASWEAATLSAEGNTVAALPYYRKRRPDGWAITLPALIRYCGPLYDAGWPEATGHDRAANRLLATVPTGYRSFDQTWPHPPAQAALGSFGLTQRTTHRIDFLDRTIEGLQADQSRNMRSDLRRAQRHFEVRFAEALTDEIHDVLEAPFVRQGIPAPYAREHLDAVAALLASRGHLGCACAYSGEGELCAVSVFVRGTFDAYALVTGSVDAARKNNGGSLVLWRGTTWALGQGVRWLDYLGSDHPGIAANLRHLGGQPAAYAHVHRDGAFWTKALRSWRNRD